MICKAFPFPWEEKLYLRETDDIKYIVLCQSGDTKPQTLHFSVKESGAIYQYRPINAKVELEKDQWWNDLSSETPGGIDDRFIGICFQGNFYQEDMCRVQEDAAVMLIAVLSLVYDNAMVLAHRNLEYESQKKSITPGKLLKFPFGRLNRKVDVCKNNLRTLFGEPKISGAYRALWKLIEDIPCISPANELKPFYLNDAEFAMVKIAGGTFWMGAQTEPTLPCYDEEAARSPMASVCLGEKPPHRVSVPDFYLCETVVTNALWKEVLGEVPGKTMEKDSSEHWAQLPVECVSWNDCQEFIRKLNALTNRVFRLPTEAEWEYAAKGGKYSHHYLFAGSDSLDDVAVVSNAPCSLIYPVKSKLPNELGLYDMTGNVWEWCEDWYASYDEPSDKKKREALNDDEPGDKDKTKRKVLRGGGWTGNPLSYRNTNRELASPDVRYRRFGLRLALSAE